MAVPTSAVQILQKNLANGAPSTHGLTETKPSVRGERFAQELLD